MESVYRLRPLVVTKLKDLVPGDRNTFDEWRIAPEQPFDYRQSVVEGRVMSRGGDDLKMYLSAEIDSSRNEATYRDKFGFPDGKMAIEVASLEEAVAKIAEIRLKMLEFDIEPIVYGDRDATS